MPGAGNVEIWIWHAGWPGALAGDQKEIHDRCHHQKKKLTQRVPGLDIDKPSRMRAAPHCVSGNFLIGGEFLLAAAFFFCGGCWRMVDIGGLWRLESMSGLVPASARLISRPISATEPLQAVCSAEHRPIGVANARAAGKEQIPSLLSNLLLGLSTMNIWKVVFWWAG